jgi:aryl-alcohol dehydrogenase-like predicted oxidoreductase
MKYRCLGKLPELVSVIGLGTSQLSNTDGKFRGVKYVSPKEAQRILSFAIDNGVNFFDTADNYGNAEILLGKLGADAKKQIIIATKAGLRLDGIRDFSDSYLLQQVERSLKRLSAERLDLFMLNKPGMDELNGGRLFTLLDNLKKSGKIKYSGLVVGDAETGEFCIKTDFIDCIQVMHNLLYSETLTLIEHAARDGVGVIVRSPLNSGLLSGYYTSETVFPDNDERLRYFPGKQFQERLAALYKIQEDIPVSDDDLLEFSLQYLISNKNVSVVIPGASSLSQAERYISCGEKGELDEQEMQRIRIIVARHIKGLKQNFQTLGNVEYYSHKQSRKKR